jgi:hypothetical protein
MSKERVFAGSAGLEASAQSDQQSTGLARRSPQRGRLVVDGIGERPDIRQGRLVGL